MSYHYHLAALSVCFAMIACDTAVAAAPVLKPPTEGVVFDGRSYAVVEEGKHFDLERFTLATWFKVKWTLDMHCFMNRGGPFELFTFGINKRSGRDGSGFRFTVEYGKNKCCQLASGRVRPRWTHCAATYDGKQTKVYVNGELRDSHPAAGRMPHSKVPLYLGARAPGISSLEGQLEDICIWKRALSAEEMARVVAGETGGSLAEGIVARWTAASRVGDAWPTASTPKITARYVVNREPTCPKADGYWGIWDFNQPQGDDYLFKYSGGVGTSCAKHQPFAIYAPEVNKTFFCYGGADAPDEATRDMSPKSSFGPTATPGSGSSAETLLHMVSYYDHTTGMVPRPTILLDKKTDDAHDNPVIALDARGHVWIFSSSHGTARPSYVSVSTRPYCIDAFQRVLTTNFSYPQPFYSVEEGFFVPHTIYFRDQWTIRGLHQMVSPNGRTWSDPVRLARIGQGHYAVSNAFGRELNQLGDKQDANRPGVGACPTASTARSTRRGSIEKIGMAFNYHPERKGLNWRTNVYYMETDDHGQTWRNAQGEPLALPLTEPRNPALAHDYESRKRNVYLKDVLFDREGRPVILYVTSGGWRSGPENGPRVWHTARWTGKTWDIQGSIESDNNYDAGSLYIESDGTWRLIAPTEVGPQPFNTGGEVAMWISRDQGHTWAKLKQLTRHSQYNHCYVRRPVNAHPDFYAFWADGHGRRRSTSRLYFTNQQGDHVWRLPVRMTGDRARPDVVR